MRVESNLNNQSRVLRGVYLCDAERIPIMAVSFDDERVADNG